MVDAKKIPFYKIGGSLRFKLSDIEKYIKSARFEPEIK